MSEAAERSEGPAIGALHEVRATFDDPDAMQEAVARLEMSGFDRADLSLPEAVPPAERATPEAGARPVDTEEDARQTRTLNTGGAAAAVGMAAAGWSSPQEVPRCPPLRPRWWAPGSPAGSPTRSAPRRATTNRRIESRRRRAAC
jgi:hypothetical protein